MDLFNIVSPRGSSIYRRGRDTTVGSCAGPRRRASSSRTWCPPPGTASSSPRTTGPATASSPRRSHTCSNIFTEKIFTPQVATLDSSGQTLAPRLGEGGVTPRPGAGAGAGSGGGAAGSVAVPVIAAILVTTTAMLAAVYVYRKRRLAGSLVELETEVHPKVRNHGEGPY